MRLAWKAVIAVVAMCMVPELQAEIALKAGAGRSEIALPASSLPVDGFAAQHDPLFVRTLLLDESGHRVGIVVIDQTSLFPGNVDRYKKIFSEKTGATANDIIIVAEHGFSAPHTIVRPNADEAAKEHIHQLDASIVHAIADSAEMATSRLQDAKIGFGCGKSRVSVNRDVLTAKGWWLGANDSGFSDPALCEMRVDSLSGAPIAVVMNYAVQPAVLDNSKNSRGERVISSDLAGAAAQYLEDRLGNGATALFLIGAAGDQVPYLQANRYVEGKDGNVTRVDLQDAGFHLLELQGERLGVDANAVAKAIQTGPSHKLQVTRRSVAVGTQQYPPNGLPSAPVTSYEYKAGPDDSVQIVFMQIGDTVVVGVQVELPASMGARIREKSPFAQTMVVTMVDGAAKYMAESEAYDRFTYEARNSRYAKGSAEKLESFILAQLEELHRTK